MHRYRFLHSNPNRFIANAVGTVQKKTPWHGFQVAVEGSSRTNSEQPKPMRRGSSFCFSRFHTLPVFFPNIDTLFQNFPSVNRNFNTRFHVLPIPSIFPTRISHFVLANYLCVGITIIELH
jgi:hypothetical protein